MKKCGCLTKKLFNQISQSKGKQNVNFSETFFKHLWLILVNIFIYIHSKTIFLFQILLERGKRLFSLSQWEKSSLCWALTIASKSGWMSEVEMQSIADRWSSVREDLYLDFVNFIIENVCWAFIERWLAVALHMSLSGHAVTNPRERACVCRAKVWRDQSKLVAGFL